MFKRKQYMRKSCVVNLLIIYFSSFILVWSMSKVRMDFLLKDICVNPLLLPELPIN